MSNLYLSLLLGLALGLRHALDSDHIVAMSTLISRARMRGVSWLLGACWGIGHTLTILAVGALIIVAKVHFPERLGAGLEFIVGVMLAALGAMNLAGVRLGSWGMTEHTHRHAHEREEHHHHIWPEPDARQHAHSHFHNIELEALIKAAGKFQLLRSLGVGLVHGLAGSTAVALLVLAAIPGRWEEMIYLLVFGLGSMISMALLSAFMETVLRRTMDVMRLERWMIPATGMMSLAFGLYIMYEFRTALGGRGQ